MPTVQRARARKGVFTADDLDGLALVEDRLADGEVEGVGFDRRGDGESVEWG